MMMELKVNCVDPGSLLCNVVLADPDPRGCSEWQ